MRTRRPFRLFWRVYLNGLLLLLLVALAVAGVAAALGREPAGRSPERFAAYAAARVAELRGDPPALARELRRLQEAFGARLAFFAGGAPVAASDDAPAEPLPPGDAARVAEGPLRVSGHRFAVAAPVPGVNGYVVVTGHVPQHAAVRGVSLLAAVLLALALASLPLAHAIAAPLERLGRAVRGFGAGDLGARARLASGGEVGEVAAAFDQMADRIQALVRGEKELLANVSHELRTPLARIRVALEMAAEGDLERSRRYLAEIGTDLDELSRLVEDVLTAARLDLASGGGAAAALPLRRERVAAAELVRRAAERFRLSHPGRAVALALDEGLPELDADPTLLRRVLDNLLDNAAKYSDPGQPIALVARASGGALEVEVRDRGIGVDAADLPRLFTPFFRSDRSRARGTGGVGLGLALARRVVEAHGGRIAAESAPGQGTCVRFSVPGAAAS